MADTGFLNSSAYGSYKNEWTNPTYVYSNNSTYAVSNTSSDDNEEDYYNFAIPDLSGTVINGIEVSMEAGNTYYFPTTWTCQCKLSGDGGSTWTDGINQSWSGWFSYAYASWGGATELWGKVWSYTHLTDANFRVYLNTTGGRSSDGLSADHLRVKIYYTAGTTTSISTSTTSSSTSTTSSSTSTTATTISTTSSSTSSTSHSTSSTSISTTSTSRSTSSTSTSSTSRSTSTTSSSSSSTSTTMTGTTISTSTSSSSSSSSTSTTTLMYKPSADVITERMSGDSLRV